MKDYNDFEIVDEIIDTPEIEEHNIEEALITKTPTSLSAENELKGAARRGKPVIDIFMRTKLLIKRTMMLENGAKPMIDVQGETSYAKIAEKELKQGKLPLYVLRIHPDGKWEKWYLNELIYTLK
ncbi:MAG: hypothetical protein QW478_00625 [Candidatus Micrarchaeaceae archaeon]